MKFFAHVGVMLTLTGTLVAEWKWDWEPGELRTVAYKVGSSQELEGDLREQGPLGDRTKPVSEPKRLLRATSASRFFGDGDVLWDWKKFLVDCEVLKAEAKWAIMNETSGWVVVRGDHETHWLLERFMEAYLGMSPKLVTLQTRLLKVAGRELGLVAWTPQLLRERNAEEVMMIGSLGRRGQEVRIRLEEEGMKGELIAELNHGANGRFLDTRLEYSVHLEDGRTIDLRTGLTLWAGAPFYMELGSIDDPRTTYLLELTGDVQFVDGTPTTDWRQYENPKHQPPRAVPLSLSAASQKSIGKSGQILGIWPVPPYFLRELRLSEERPELDPFGGDRELRPKYPIVKAPPELGPRFENTLLIDVGVLMHEIGIEVPNDGWVYFAPRVATFVTRLDAQGSELFADVVVGIVNCSPSLINVVVSQIEWNGRPTRAGVIPKGARRLGRAGLTARPGQKATLVFGKTVDGKLVEGFSLEVEPNVGANAKEVHLRYDYLQSGANQMKTENKLVLTRGVPQTIPIGRSDGKSRALVVEAMAIEVTGEPRR